jgi:hypothetical protein
MSSIFLFGPKSFMANDLLNAFFRREIRFAISNNQLIARE